MAGSMVLTREKPVESCQSPLPVASSLGVTRLPDSEVLISMP